MQNGVSVNHTNKTILEKIREGYGLPVLSPIAIRLRELASSENSSVNDLADLIAKDPSLTVRMLRLANSAFYGNTGQITTIDCAVMKIGFMRLRTMALAIALRDTFPMGKVGPMDYEEFWKSSMYRAIIAKNLARKSGKCNPDEAFVVGLTLEIGQLILFDLFIKNKLGSMPGHYSFEKHLEWERQQFGVDHREIGQQALRYWNFPKIMLECQEVLTEKRHANVTPLALLCDMARRFSYLVSDKKAGWHLIFTEVEMLYGIKSPILTSLLASAFHDVQEISESLHVKISREEDLIELLGKAKYTLEKISLTISKWILFAFDGQGEAGSDPMVQYSLTERLQEVTFEIARPLAIIREFIDNLVPVVSPNTKEWKYVIAVSQEVKKVELAALLLK